MSAFSACALVAVSLQLSSGDFFLCPRLVLVLDNGDEIITVEDRLGPLSTPSSFYVDFAAVDERGRNVQMDVIFRAVQDDEEWEDSPSGKKRKAGMRTLRTCLQDYTAMNNQVQPANISLGYSTLAMHLPGAQVYLQNLVISEDHLASRPTEPQPFDVWKEAAHRPESETLSKILFEGQDAHVASMAMNVPEPYVKHPQLQLSDAPARRPSMNGNSSTCKLVTKPLLTEPTTSDFWHHIQYGTDQSSDDGDDCGGINGEFWLTKQAVEKKGVYFHTSSTLAQSLTMCIIFRFTCPLEYLTIIESNGASILRDTHIPTNGLVMGIERDPRHESMVRMFFEHRNEIIDDMVICEVKPSDLARCVVHQEVYDSGSSIIYRLTLMHADGARQLGVLQTGTEQLEDPYDYENRRSSQLPVVEEPSTRFPISPCAAHHENSMSPVNRIFVYTGVAHEELEDEFATDEIGSVGSHSQGALQGVVSRAMSQTSIEDWQSAGGGFSDGEEQPGQDRVPRLGNKEGGKDAALWQRPLVESALLMSRLNGPPFPVDLKSLKNK